MLLCLSTSHWGCASDPIRTGGSGHVATEEKKHQAQALSEMLCS